MAHNYAPFLILVAAADKKEYPIPYTRMFGKTTLAKTATTTSPL